MVIGLNKNYYWPNEYSNQFSKKKFKVKNYKLCFTNDKKKLKVVYRLIKIYTFLSEKSLFKHRDDGERPI